MEDLPYEIIVEIASWLGYRELDSLRKVNKHFYLLITPVMNKKREEHFAFIVRHITGLINKAGGKLPLPSLIVLLMELPEDTLAFNEKSEVLVITEMGDPLLDRIRSFTFGELIENDEICEDYLTRERKRAISHNILRGGLRFQILPLTWAWKQPKLTIREFVGVLKLLLRHSSPSKKVRFVAHGRRFETAYAEGVFRCRQV